MYFPFFEPHGWGEKDPVEEGIYRYLFLSFTNLILSNLNSVQNYPIQPDNHYFLIRIQIIFWIETRISEQFKSQRH